jgi:hypothetical protein
MFPRMNITTPLSSLAYCAPQYGAGVTYGGINPMVSCMVSPYASGPYASGPAPVPYPMIGPSPYPVIGPSPYPVQSMIPYPPGVIPYPPGQIGAGIAPWCNPLSWSPYAFAQPTPIHPAMHPAFAGMSPAAFSSPVPCIDPVTGAVVPQPYPAAQTLLPIRPLITAQPDPVQMAALCGMMAPQVVDPYSVMAQACLTSPLAVSPVQSALRPPIYLSPFGSQQVGVPCTVTTGIPC